jgi:hypothetical protein
MSATAENTVEGYLGDLIAVNRHVGEAIARHAKDERVHRIAGAGQALEHADTVLTAHRAALEAYAKTVGGTGWAGALKDSVTTVTGFITGLYGTIRGEAASRMLRDDYTGVSFVLICTQMLHTTAIATGDVTIKTMLYEHIEQLAEVIMKINRVLPQAVVTDLGSDGVPLSNPRAGEEAARAHAQAWKQASENQK